MHNSEIYQKGLNVNTEWKYVRLKTQQGVRSSYYLKKITHYLLLQFRQLMTKTYIKSNDEDESDHFGT